MKCLSMSNLFSNFIWGVCRVDGCGYDAGPSASAEYHWVLDAVGQKDTQDLAIRVILSPQTVAEFDRLVVSLTESPRLACVIPKEYKY